MLLVTFRGAPTYWKSKKQSLVSRTSSEAEYWDMSSIVREILWLRWLLKELELPCESPTQQFCENQVTQHIANNPICHE